MEELHGHGFCTRQGSESSRGDTYYYYTSIIRNSSNRLDLNLLNRVGVRGKWGCIDIQRGRLCHVIIRPEKDIETIKYVYESYIAHGFKGVYAEVLGDIFRTHHVTDQGRERVHTVSAVINRKWVSQSPALIPPVFSALYPVPPSFEEIVTRGFVNIDQSVADVTLSSLLDLRCYDLYCTIVNRLGDRIHPLVLLRRIPSHADTEIYHDIIENFAERSPIGCIVRAAEGLALAGRLRLFENLIEKTKDQLSPEAVLEVFEETISCGHMGLCHVILDVHKSRVSEETLLKMFVNVVSLGDQELYHRLFAELFGCSTGVGVSALEELSGKLDEIFRYRTSVKDRTMYFKIVSYTFIHSIRQGNEALFETFCQARHFHGIDHEIVRKGFHLAIHPKERMESQLQLAMKIIETEDTRDPWLVLDSEDEDWMTRPRLSEQIEVNSLQRRDAEVYYRALCSKDAFSRIDEKSVQEALVCAAAVDHGVLFHKILDSTSLRAKLNDRSRTEAFVFSIMKENEDFFFRIMRDDTYMSRKEKEVTYIACMRYDYGLGCSLFTSEESLTKKMEYDMGVECAAKDRPQIKTRAYKFILSSGTHLFDKEVLVRCRNELTTRSLRVIIAKADYRNDCGIPFMIITDTTLQSKLEGRDVEMMFRRAIESNNLDIVHYIMSNSLLYDKLSIPGICSALERCARKGLFDEFFEIFASSHSIIDKQSLYNALYSAEMFGNHEITKELVRRYGKSGRFHEKFLIH